MAFVVQHLHQFLDGSIHIHGAHVHAGRHDFAYGSLHEVEDVQNHLLFFFFEAFLLAVARIRKVRLHGVTHFFGQEAQLGIVTEQFEQLDKQHVANLSHGDERKPDYAEQRDEDYRQSIRLEIRNQVRDEHAHDIDDNACDNRIHGKRYVGVLLHVGTRRILEQEEPEQSGTHVSEDAADGHALVETAPLDDIGNLLFAVVSILGIALRVNQAERTLGRRKNRRRKQEQAQHDYRKSFGILHQAFSLYGSRPRNSHSRLRITLRSAALMWS